MSWERKVRKRIEKYTMKEREEGMPVYQAFPQTGGKDSTYIYNHTGERMESWQNKLGYGKQLPLALENF